jgi:hypothetical protein
MVEAFLRRAEACGRGALVNQIGGTFSAITAKTWGVFEHCGYHASLQPRSKVP